MILLQGDEDEVVPPSQSEVMVEALGRQGDRRTRTCSSRANSTGSAWPRRSVGRYEAELSFYAQILGFELGDPIEPVPIIGA